MPLPETIVDDLGELLDALASRGFQPEHSEPGSMHSYLVRFSGPVPLEIVCDRSQFFVQGERAQLEPRRIRYSFRIQNYSRIQSLFFSSGQSVIL